MVKINNNLLKLDNKDTFESVFSYVRKYKLENPDKEVISLGVGDVTIPIIKPVIEAMHKAVDELGDMDTFKGYGPSHGYDFLKEKILDNEYKNYNFSLDEIYISSGTKTDVTNILELFDNDIKIAIPEPIYPIYKNGSLCLNKNITVLESDDDFYPIIPNEKYDLIYLCSPNNPTGIAYNFDYLKKWIDYAIKNDSIILYDNVYNSFITNEYLPKTIYEINGAKKKAIEFRSFSKNASFTGVRCSYYIIPNDIGSNINSYWKNRTINRFNGADYIAQKSAEATFLTVSKEMINDNIKIYLENARLLKDAFERLNFKVWGGIDSPFIWVKTKDNLSSCEMFDFFLKELNIIIIPGTIFGSSGEGYFRISALGKKEHIIEAIERIYQYYEKDI